VDNGDFDRLFQQLLLTMDEAVDLLRRVGEQWWSGWIAADRQAIERGDRRALDHFLSAFGGMGSLNDLQIDPHNGHHVGEDEVEAVNDLLSRLLGDAYRDAKAMRELDRL
jgi:hypothetical protein